MQTKNFLSWIIFFMCWGVSLVFSLKAQGEHSAPIKESPQLVEGSSVRLWTPIYLSQGKVVKKNQAIMLLGKIVSITADTLILESKNYQSPVLVPKKAIYKLQVSRGRGRLGVGKGVLYGAVGGAIVGLIAASDAASNPKRAEPKDFYYRTLIPAAALLGTGLGALVGAITPTEHWEDVPLDMKLGGK